MKVTESHQVDVLAFTVFRDPHEIGDAGKAGFAREVGRDLRALYGFDGFDLDLAFVHGVAAADLDAGLDPDPNTTGNFAPTDSLSKAFCEDHGERLQQGQRVHIDHQRRGVPLPFSRKLLSFLEDGV